jgi:hypothetical protein
VELMARSSGDLEAKSMLQGKDDAVVLAELCN